MKLANGRQDAKKMLEPLMSDLIVLRTLTHKHAAVSLLVWLREVIYDLLESRCRTLRKSEASPEIGWKNRGFRNGKDHAIKRVKGDRIWFLSGWKAFLANCFYQCLKAVGWIKKFETGVKGVLFRLNNGWTKNLKIVQLLHIKMIWWAPTNNASNR